MPTYVVKNDYPRIAAKLKVESKAAENAGARVLALRAKADAAVLTGEMRNSIRAHGNTVTATSGHAGYQQFGTSKMKAHPYFWDGVEQAQSVQMAMLLAVFR